MVSVHDAAEAAIRLAESTGREVADLTLAEIATAAGVSRSTLRRHIDGRAEIDAELRRRGAGALSLRERVLAAAAALVAAEGMSALTLERVAADATCTVVSIYQRIGGRDALLVELFDEHAVFPVLEPFLDAAADLETVVGRVYEELIDYGLGGSTVASALMIEGLARPDSALAAHIRAGYLPRVTMVMERFFGAQVRRGAVREQSTAALLAQFFGPVQFYVHVAIADQLPRPPGERTAVAAELAANFVRAVREDRHAS